MYRAQYSIGTYISQVEWIIITLNFV
jgi:hypothetical protein